MVNKEKVLAEEEKLVARQRAEARRAIVHQLLEQFSRLPNEAHVRLPVVMALYACSAATVWRNVKTGAVPVPRKFGSRVTAWNVGELRASLAA
ncbi:AlpA family transcriptional regulator [Azonexus fungiphilus]|uniref:AlpA family transcriptional regulator n=1 Tax=Azonexus fungiphilus TaxID=146940 RepID=A0A495WQP9_9RHOO|nr:AlpA family phage regulatory protein [Azonexus fungiphilus]RKT63095.1 AlpA family transcriptional regulator [Azonexus fungiphilus]